MINLPAFSEQSLYDAETLWHLQLTEERLTKFLAHWEFMQRTQHVPGAVVECGVFKGTSFARLAMMRQILGGAAASKLIGFDTFADEYPSTGHPEDLAQRLHFVSEAGASSISVEQLTFCLNRLGVRNFELVAGDACQTIPEYVKKNLGLRIAFLNLDIDFIEPTLTALETLFPLVMPGGIVALDNYAGEGTSGIGLYGDTAAVDEYFSDSSIEIRRLPFASRPAYIVKPAGFQVR